MMKPLRIGLAVNHSYAYYRGVLRGVAHYAEMKPEWLSRRSSRGAVNSNAAGTSPALDRI